MDILTKQQAHSHSQTQAKAFQETIQKICDAYLKGMADLYDMKGYHNSYTKRAEDVAYNLGWNKVSNYFNFIEK